MALHARPIVLGAISSFVFAALVTTGPPANAAVSGESSVATTSFGGSGPAQVVRGDGVVSHTGTYSRSLPLLGVSGEEGTASSAASQTATAEPQGITATGSGQVSAAGLNGGDASGYATSEYELEGWAVPASGRWRVTLSLRATGSGQCGGPVTGRVRLGWFPIVDKIMYCNDGPTDADVVIRLVAGEELDLYGLLSIHVHDGSQEASWAITITPVSLDDPVDKPKTVHPSASVLPKISGKKKVGKTLSATVGSWKNNPTAFTFQWLRKGKKIAGATASTYKVKKADKGKKLSVQVTAGNSAGKTTVTSKAVKIKKPKKK